MNLLRSLLGRSAEKRYTVSDYANWLEEYGGGWPLVASSAHSDKESIENNFVGYVQGAYKRNGVVFAAILTRMLLFSEARFQYQHMEKSRPGKLWGNESLSLLETPWPNGTTGELLSRMIQDADLAGNFFASRRDPKRLRRLRPDWVDIILTAPPAEATESDIIGYAYQPGGKGGDPRNMELFTVDEIVHWAPIPDPEAQYRGMSWLTPVIREIEADQAATTHKLKFFENGAQLQTVLTLGDSVTKEQFGKWVRKFRESHQGVRNAYEPLFLGGGADAKVVGADLKQLDFKVTQGAGETRIAMASMMSPVILSMSEGLAGSSLNAGNFQASRRLAADKALRPLWRSACAALATVIRVPKDSRLWYDDRDIPFLREDAKDLAEIQSTEGQTIRTLVDAGYVPETVVEAVISQDWSLLKHTGTYSVQLQPPTSNDPKPESDPASTEPKPEGDTKTEKKRDVTEALQKLYLAVGTVVTPAEAREIANGFGAGLELPGPYPGPEDEPAEPVEDDSAEGPPTDTDPIEEPTEGDEPDDGQEQD